MPVRSIHINPALLINLPRQDTNQGLWFQKYYNSEANQPSQALIDSITKLSNQVDPIYERFYKRWVTSLNLINAHTEIAETQGRMVVNLGAESVAEVSLALHHTYGLPYIPGTALKGLAAHYANSNMGAAWKKGTDAYKAIFGTGKTAGYVTFHDALLIPEDGNRKPLQKDTVTGHHQDYNKGDNVPPADWDSPTIIPFISVHGKFLIAISGDEKAKPVAMEILRLALLNEGIGAKTSSGYGRMEFESHAGDILKDTHLPTSTTPENPEESYDVMKKRLLKNEDPPAGWKRGYVRTVKDEGDYGFIVSASGGSDVYIDKDTHPEGLVKVDEVLEYLEERTSKGLRAKSVKVLLRKE